MANNKVVLSDGTTLMDITDTTATASDVASGQVFYGANGVRTVGTSTGSNGLVVTFTREDSTWVADKTYAEIAANINAGVMPIGKYSNSYYPLDSFNSNYVSFAKQSRNQFIQYRITSEDAVSYLIGYVNRGVDFTLIATNWDDTVYTISNPYITANNFISITYPATITDAELDAIAQAQIRYSEQIDGSITLRARGKVPTINIPLFMKIGDR